MVAKLPVLGNVHFISILLMGAGIAWALININSLPMVVDLTTAARVGTFTGLYYLFSTFSAIVGPNLNGLIVTLAGGRLQHHHAHQPALPGHCPPPHAGREEGRSAGRVRKGALRLAGVLLLLTAVSACGTDRGDCAQPQVYCVGLVTSTARLDDHGLNASAWEGMQGALQDGTIQIADPIESVDARDYEKNIAYFVEHGYDLVVSVGQGQTDVTRAAAEKYPKVRFLGLDQTASEAPLPNLQVVPFAKEQGGFQAGALAALVSESNIVGAVCETSGIDSMWQYCEGFRLGALHENERHHRAGHLSRERPPGRSLYG